MVKDTLVAGFDEAGLGPIIGPLVIGGVIMKTQDYAKLRKIGVDDSKKFGSSTRSRRNRKGILIEAASHLDYAKYEIITAREIDENLINGVNMYDLEAKAISNILNSSDLFQDLVETIYLHQVGTMKKGKMIEKLLMNGVSENICEKIIYEKGADKKYIPVSMASIIAKVTRDEHLEQISTQVCGEYISGYPTSITQKFLEQYLESEKQLSNHVRFTRNWDPLNRLKKRCLSSGDLQRYTIMVK